MLKFLLDEHVSPDVAEGFRRLNRTIPVQALANWENGSLLGQDDITVIREAAMQGFTLVTYDSRTIPPLLKVLAEEGRQHGGVVFVDEKTISPADIGGLVKALVRLASETGSLDWTDRIYFLRR